MPGIIIISLLLSLATVAPKFVSGSSLAELNASGTSANLKAEGLLGQMLALFDTTLELWSGRLAMFGFVGLIIAEGIKGDALF